MRREELYLRDIVEAVNHIADFIVQIDFAAFQESELVRSAVVQKLASIGEAAAHISDGLKARYPQVPWPRIVAFRNILIHAYFGIDWTEVWFAATRQAPGLGDQMASILRAESDRARDSA
jgi:uncharacterized protein with HEPN domain